MKEENSIVKFGPTFAKKMVGCKLMVGVCPANQLLQLANRFQYLFIVDRSKKLNPE
jgi:hypothetical protein